MEREVQEAVRSLEARMEALRGVIIDTQDQVLALRIQLNHIESGKRKP